MTRTYCDICGEEIRKDDIRRRFKIKEYARGLELKWTPLVVHNYCWKDLTELIRQHRNENGGEL